MISTPNDLAAIRDLLASQDGHAWLYGKGWSLAKHDFAKDGPVRLCVNESVVAVPNPTAGILTDADPLQRIVACCPNVPLIVSTQIDSAYEFVKPALASAKRILWFVKGDYPKPGTAAAALALLGESGIKDVHMVGFDLFFRPLEIPDTGTTLHPYAKSVEVAYRPGMGKPRRGCNYDAFSESMRQAIAMYGLTIHDESK